MKKLLFTALAVVAISATSFGKNLKNEKLEKISLEVYSCTQDQEAAFDACMSNGCGYWTSYFYGAGAWGTCMRG